jgi:uncharacterized phiE125 gp8 family phage protein
MALESLANIKTHLGITTSADDAFLTELQAAAESWISQHCGRSFEGGTFVEDFAGFHRTLRLRHYPVVSVTSVKVDLAWEFGPETILDSSRYYLHAEYGLVESLHGPFGTGAAASAGTVRVTYTVATDAVPAEVKRAAAELVGHWYRQAKTHSSAGQLNLTSQADGTGYPCGQSTGYRLPQGVLQLLQPHRVPGV